MQILLEDGVLPTQKMRTVSYLELALLFAIGDSQLCFLRCDDISDEDSTMCLLDGGDR